MEVASIEETREKANSRRVSIVTSIKEIGKGIMDSRRAVREVSNIQDASRRSTKVSMVPCRIV